MVCHFPAPLRDRHIIVALKIYVDDSGTRQPPVYILAGWIAQADQWASFSDQWQATLDMRPKIAYFKFVEAMTLSGEFSGISASSRDEKMNLMVNLLRDFDLLGVSITIPHAIFNTYFGDSASPDIRNPYSLAFYAIISIVFKYLTSIGYDDNMDFIFDTQDDQVDNVRDGWRFYASNLPDDQRKKIGYPNFYDDKRVLPLQAADMFAGWTRRMDAALLTGELIPRTNWSERAPEIKKLGWVMDEAKAAEMYFKLHGHWRQRVTGHFGYGSRYLA
jgi:Protein of unknown function (DUF3800)